MDLQNLLNLQGMLFLIIGIGVWLRKRGVIDNNGKRCLTDVTIGVVIPCNIVRAFLVDFGPELLISASLLLLVGTLLQVLSLLCNKVLYNRYEPQQKHILQYATICTNGGFMGNPIAEGVYGQLGLMYASVFLIPMRIVTWSFGVSYFTSGEGGTSRKEVFKQVVTHPCLIAIYIGTALLLLQPPLPRVLVSTITAVGGCNTFLTMLIIGSILADVDIRTIVSRTSIFYTLIRLVALPLVAYLFCLLLGLDRVATGVSVLMTGMPAASTTAIFAAKYGSDAAFAIRIFVLSVLCSLLTIPLWCLFIG